MTQFPSTVQKISVDSGMPVAKYSKNQAISD